MQSVFCSYRLRQWVGSDDAHALLPVPEGPIIRILSVGRFSSLDMAAGDEVQRRRDGEEIRWGQNRGGFKSETANGGQEGRQAKANIVVLFCVVLHERTT